MVDSCDLVTMVLLNGESSGADVFDKKIRQVLIGAGGKYFFLWLPLTEHFSFIYKQGSFFNELQKWNVSNCINVLSRTK